MTVLMSWFSWFPFWGFCFKELTRSSTTSSMVIEREEIQTSDTLRTLQFSLPPNAEVGNDVSLFTYFACVFFAFQPPMGLLAIWIDYCPKMAHYKWNDAIILLQHISYSIYQTDQENGYIMTPLVPADVSENPGDGNRHSTAVPKNPPWR
ncbi:hypothetical protein VTN00DRAFT_2285 [Thermoascus crustaceus]|uniref:uncharacterized protein n=1 Tax=Thermoascus crustaceus TaxID=5088 RepID=UPI003743F369